MVRFRSLNLLHDFTALGRFDVVFCRNVLGGFDQATRRDVLHRIAWLMPRDGTLILGAGETAAGPGDESGSLFERGGRGRDRGPRLAVVGGR
jgi:chemotaxis protein methyltransferase CheR